MTKQIRLTVERRETEARKLTDSQIESMLANWPEVCRLTASVQKIPVGTPAHASLQNYLAESLRLIECERNRRMTRQ